MYVFQCFRDTKNYFTANEEQSRLGYMNAVIAGETCAFLYDAFFYGAA